MTNQNPSLIQNPFKVDTIWALLDAVLNDFILPVGAILAVLAFIYSGFKYVMAQGKPEELKTANKNLLYVAIGTAVLLGAKVLATVIEATVNQLK